jgi:hypothetical protein
MPTAADNPPLSQNILGYLLVEHDPQVGFIGGYLLVTSRGRPLEFHCTAPVQPTRAQEILFGATLEAYVKADLIGAALVQKAKLRPDVLFVAELSLLSVGSEGNPSTVLLSLNETNFSPFGTQPETLLLCESLAQQLDLAEPFERIREAIREAQRLSAPVPQPIPQATPSDAQAA